MDNFLGEKVKLRREELGMTQDELAKRLGYASRTSINKIENGRRVTQKIIVKLAEALHTTPSYLMGWDDVQPKDLFPIEVVTMHRVPLFRYIPASCGYGSWAEDDVIDYIGLPSSVYKFSKGKKYFGQIAEGDSMIGLDINNGDLLIFEQCEVPDNNMIGVFSINNERCLCKKIRMNEDKIYLLSANDNYMPIEITSDMEFRVVGKLKYIVKEFKH